MRVQREGARRGGGGSVGARQAQALHARQQPHRSARLSKARATGSAAPTCTDTSSPDASDSVPISRISSWAQACSTSRPRRPLRQ